MCAPAWPPRAAPAVPLQANAAASSGTPIAYFSALIAKLPPIPSPYFAPACPDSKCRTSRYPSAIIFVTLLGLQPVPPSLLRHHLVARRLEFGTGFPLRILRRLCDDVA